MMRWWGYRPECEIYVEWVREGDEADGRSFVPLVTRIAEGTIMSSSHITIMVMTRDWIDLLEEALQSVFDRQSEPPPVISLLAVC
jgi:hypothetical protein